MAKQEIKQEQVLNVEEAVSRSEAFINKNKKALVIGVVAVVVLVAAGLLASTYIIAPREKAAAEALFTGEQYFQNGNYETAIVEFEAVIADHKGTKAANLAKAYTGISNAKLGNYEEAIPMLKAFKGNDAMIAPSVLAALGNCYAQVGQEAQAAATLMKAAQKADNNLLSPAYLIQAGQIYEKLGKKSDALKAYTQIKEKYYGSMQAMDIDKYIERVK
ncbi:MAG: tetratricopeptide repeat protein [Bacteroidaceae bacterium]|nr:tetratricopeptide repeat protein [Bacteroidaceae bacterium]